MKEPDAEPDHSVDAPTVEVPLEWYCVRSKAKSEHIAAAHLKRYAGLEVFCPRIRFLKPTVRGKVWFVEALFPGYFFARFDRATHLRAVNAGRGVIGLVNFGDFCPSIPEQLVLELKEEFDETEVREITDELVAGDEATLIEGPFQGLSVVVSRVMPRNERVKILLDCLGEIREVEASKDSLVRPSGLRNRRRPSPGRRACCGRRGSRRPLGSRRRSRSP